MNPSTLEQVCRTLEASPEVLPYLPELLADLSDLGGSAEQVLELLLPLGLPAGARALDLGCGKGGIALILAEQLGFHVEGIDAFPPFIEEAKKQAAERGLSSLCDFRVGDLREALEKEGDFDLALLIAVGPFLVDLARSVGALRRSVRPGGFMVIDDGYLAEGMAGRPHGYEQYAERGETIRRLTSHGDRLVREILLSREEIAAVNEQNTAAIRRRAAELVKKDPRAESAVRAHVAEQERVTRLDGEAVIDALWLLERGP